MGILNIIYRGVLTFDALLLMVLIYIIKSSEFSGTIILDFLPLQYALVIGVIIFALFLTKILLILKKWLSMDIVTDINTIESADSRFFPLYLGYFFVALSIPNYQTFVAVFLILFILNFVSHTEYYNPLFYFFRYRFYTITYGGRRKIHLISNVDIINSDSYSFENIRRINDYTYILTEVTDDNNR